MSALVTGGTGFLGSHVIEQLSQTGDIVHALARQASADEYLRSLGAIPVRGDLDDTQSLERACDGCDIIYHCAAKVELYGSKKDFYNANVDGTRRLVEAAKHAGVHRFVYVSSCAVYLNRHSASVVRAGKSIDEFTPAFQPPSWYVYGRAKYRGEEVLRTGRTGPMEWTVVRLGQLYGPRDRKMMSYLGTTLKDRLFRIVGDGSNELTLTYVEDAARAVVLAGRCGEAGNKILVAVPQTPCTQCMYINALADGFGVPRPTRHRNLYVAFAFAWLGEYLVRSGPRRAWLRRSFIAILGLPAKISCAYTCALLKWEPTVTLAEGMKRTFEWYRAEYGEETVAGETEPQLSH